MTLTRSVLLSISLLIFVPDGVLPDKPNVLFIVIDDLRPELGCYGAPILSPNIDQLAAHSVRFTNAHIQQAVCAPSRVSFLTGRRPDTTRLYDFGSYWRDFSGNYTTLPEHFKNNGYFAAGVGKVFHQGKASNKTFDYPYSWSVPNYWPSTEQYLHAKVCPMKDGQLQSNIICPVDLQTQPEKSLPDIQNADQAVAILKNISLGAPYIDPFGRTQKMKEPFFLAVGFRKPHVPYKYPKEYRSLYPIDSISIATDPNYPPALPHVAFEPWSSLRIYDDIAALNLSFPWEPMPIPYHYLIRQSYFASVSFMDYQVGRVLEALDKNGYANNTIISFVGDHGWQLGEHSEFSKMSNFIQATNVPLMFHVPGVTTPSHHKLGQKFPLKDPLKFTNHSITNEVESRSTDAFAEVIDLFPTISSLAGISVPPLCPKSSFNVQLCREGSSLAPMILKKEGVAKGDWKNCTISQYPRPSDEPQKNTILPKLVNITIMGYSMRTESYRYSEWVGFDHTTFEADWKNVHARELYVLKDDFDEDNNVAEDTKYASVVAELSQQLQLGWRICLPKSDRQY